MLAEILDWITNIGLAFLAAAVLVWMRYYRKMPRAIQLLGFYLLANLLIQVGADFLWQRSMNNLPLLHLNTLLEFVFITLFFREVYIEQAWFKKYFNYWISVVAFLLIVNSLFIESIYEFNSIAKTLVQVIIMTYVILYFFDAYGRVDFSQVEHQVIGLICFAILLCYAGSLFVFMFSQFSWGSNREVYRGLWLINGGLTLVFQLLILIAFLKTVFQRRKGSDTEQID